MPASAQCRMDVKEKNVLSQTCWCFRVQKSFSSSFVLAMTLRASTCCPYMWYQKEKQYPLPSAFLIGRVETKEITANVRACGKVKQCPFPSASLVSHFQTKVITAMTAFSVLIRPCIKQQNNRSRTAGACQNVSLLSLSETSKEAFPLSVQD